MLARGASVARSQQGDGGSIVNVSTIEAFRAIPTRAVYSAFKAAITGFTRSLAVEYARYGIRVNAIAPDVTETLQVPYSKWVGPDDEHLIPTWVPLGRFGQPDDVAGVAVFLASGLSGFVTGTTVHVDGGTFAAGGWFPDGGGRVDQPAASTLTPIVPGPTAGSPASTARRVVPGAGSGVRMSPMCAPRPTPGPRRRARPTARWSSCS